MNFRQRVAWLALFGYLASTCALVYYVFELSDAFNELARDHVETHHSPKGVHQQQQGAAAADGPLASFWTHFTDIPLPVWFLIFLVPYLQVFCVLYSMTRNEPRLFCFFFLPSECGRANGKNKMASSAAFGSAAAGASSTKSSSYLGASEERLLIPDVSLLDRQRPGVT